MIATYLYKSKKKRVDNKRNRSLFIKKGKKKKVKESFNKMK